MRDQAKGDIVRFSGQPSAPTPPQNQATPEPIKLPIAEAQAFFEDKLQKIRQESDLATKVTLYTEAMCEFAETPCHTGCYDRVNNASSLTPEQKARFISDICHELQMPWGSFHGRAVDIEFALEDGLSPSLNGEQFDTEVAQVFQAVLESYQRYEFFLNSEFTEKIQTPTAIFEKAMDAANVTIQGKHLSVAIDGAETLKQPDIKPWISDYDLYTTFTNVLQNAAKYTPENGAIRIHFSTGTITTPSQKTLPALIFSVEDSGIGFPPGELSDILELGQRGGNALAAKIPGTGYGLQRVQRLLSRPVPGVHVESPLHPENTDFPGSRVICKIPLKTAAAPSAET